MAATNLDQPVVQIKALPPSRPRAILITEDDRVLRRVLVIEAELTAKMIPITTRDFLAGMEAAQRINSAEQVHRRAEDASTGSTAVLRVDGTGSDFTVTAGFAEVDVGTSGNGLLAVTNGGAARIGGHLVVAGSSGTSSIQVDGSSSVEIGSAGKAVAGAITVDAYDGGGIHTLEGCGTIVADVVNNYGVYEQPRAPGAPLEITGAVTGSGVMNIVLGGVLQLDSSVASSQTVEFETLSIAGETPTLRLVDPSAFAGSLYDFSSVGDTLELVGQTVTDASVSGSTMTASLADGGPLTFNLVHSVPIFLAFSGADISVASTAPPCFRAGTLIATPMGDAAVEKLCEGDAVVSARGGIERVVWIGHRRVDCRYRPDPKQVWPVRVTANAFGPHRPQCDLWLSSNHAVYFADVLIPVKHLINGTSIVQVPIDAVTYYHVELPRHDLLLAESLPVESYMDTGDRSNFANDGHVARLFPDFSALSLDAAAMWEAHGCAPLVVCGPELAAVRTFVNAQAIIAARVAAAA